MRRCRVSSFLADVTQQIHSFRASGVILAQRLFAAASASMAFRKSAGSLWIVPPAIALVVMHAWNLADRPGAVTGQTQALRHHPQVGRVFLYS